MSRPCTGTALRVASRARWLAGSSSVLARPSSFAAGAEEPLPFEELVLPAVLVAEELLRERAMVSPGVARGLALLSPPAFQALTRHLTWELSVAAAPSLERDFDAARPAGHRLLFALAPAAERPTSRVHYERFVNALLASGFAEVFEKRPALMRLVAMLVEGWVEHVAELVTRLATDLARITETFAGEPVGDAPDTVTALLPALSDRHNGGRGVVGVSLRSGRRFAYKPRSLALEASLGELLTWLNRASGDSTLFRVLRVIDAGDYGWMEWVEPAPVADAAALTRFHERQGALLGVVHLLWGTDCHRENLIAAGEHPVLVDAEALLHHEAHPAMFGLDAPDPSSIDRTFRDSVLRTGMLPRWDLMGEGTRATDVSAIGGEAESEVAVDRWMFVNTDHMHSRSVVVQVQHRSHLPSLAPLGGGEPEPVADVDAIVRGFTATLRLAMYHRAELLADGGPIAAFRWLPTRFVLRPTQVYHRLLVASLDPDCMHEEADRSATFEVLYRGFAFTADRPPAWPLVRAEIEALERFDVPYFHGTTCGTTLRSGAFCLEGFFDRSSYERVQERVAGLSEGGLELEVSLIRGSFHARGATSFPVLGGASQASVDARPDPSSEALVLEAASIADDLVRSAHHATNGHANWIGVSRQGGGERFALQPLGGDLYAGAPGVALFLAAMERVRPGHGYGALARAAVKPLEEALLARNEALVARWAKAQGLGACTGLGSVVYVLVKLGLLLDDEAFFALASRAAERITIESIARDGTLDVLGGSAGAILGLLSLFGARGEPEILRRARSAGEHLLERRVATDSGHPAWKTVSPEPLTGFAHGAAGIAHALGRLATVTGDGRFAEAAREGIEFERSVYLPALEDPPELSSGERIHPWYMLNWCHGATGIGLSRLGLDVLSPAPDPVGRDIDAALHAVESWGLQAVDHACCGNAGRSELLLVASRRLERPELATLARRRAAWMAERARSSGGYVLFPNLTARVQSPGLFQGTAGIGYHFLRLAHPELPCVLLFE